jgi:glucose-1-phosphatase
MNGIKNIIFDLGGVLLDIDYGKTIHAFHELGIPEFEKMFTQFHADEFFSAFETGLMSRDEFLSHIRNSVSQPVSDGEITTAWNAMMLGFRSDCLPTLDKLSKEYSLFVLSNTNSIHLDCFREIFTRDTGLPLLEKYFSKCWYSHVIGLRKPQKAVYEFVLQDGGLKASETLFIDDTPANITVAGELGIRTRLLLPFEKIESVVS